jgi:hypothetical protein
MADNFCIQCGCRLTGADKFCAQCGRPVGAKIEAPERPAVRDAQFFESLGIKVRAPGSTRAPQAQQKVQGVQAIALDHILSCSLMNAPLDTDSVLLEYRHKQWADYVPLTFVKNLQEMEVHFRASAFFLVDGSESPSVRNYIRSDVPDDVCDAFINAEHYLQMMVCPQFEPKDYGELDKEIRGKWVSVVKEFKDGGTLYVVAMAVPFMLSGLVMKRRLREHEEQIKQWIARATDTGIKEDLDHCAQVVRAAIDQTPDGFADHIWCEACLAKHGEAQSLLLDEDLPKEEEAKGAKVIRAQSMPRVAAAGEPPARPGLAGAGLVRFSPSVSLRRAR